jgi:hypothetical protein
MLEHIIILVIVLLAALYVIRGLRREATGKTACAEDHCAGCPYGGGCGHREAEQCSAQDTTDETESPS